MAHVRKRYAREDGAMVEAPAAILETPAAAPRASCRSKNYPHRIAELPSLSLIDRQHVQFPVDVRFQLQSFVEFVLIRGSQMPFCFLLVSRRTYG